MLSRIKEALNAVPWHMHNPDIWVRGVVVGRFARPISGLDPETQDAWLGVGIGLALSEDRVTVVAYQAAFTWEGN